MNDKKPIGELAEDPVCGMMIPKDNPDLSSTYKGTTYHFCDVGCKEEFDIEPGLYVSEDG